MPKSARSRWVAAAAALLSLAAPFALPAPALAAPQPTPISGAGSTWSANAIDQWRVNLRQAGLFVNYTPTGSADGRAQFANGTNDFAVTDLPYGYDNAFADSDTPPARPFTYVPVTAGGLTFPYNLRVDGNQVDNLRLSGEAIFKIFTKVVTRWDDPLIKADNPGIALPAADIVTVVRGDASATSGNLTRWMNAEYPQQWNAYCQAQGGKPTCGATALFPASGHIHQQGSTGVGDYVGVTQGAIGYLESSYAIGARLSVAKMLNKAGYYIAPREGAVAIALKAAEVAGDQTPRLEPVYANPDPRAYPLSYYSYLVVPTTVGGSFTESDGYTLGELGFYGLCRGQQTAPLLGYAPLPVNLAVAGLDELAHIPGAQRHQLAECDNPTFAPDGSDTLSQTVPQPAQCDNKASGQQCAGPAARATTATLTASSTAIDTGDPVTFTVTVTPSGLAGRVTFHRGQFLFGTPVDVVDGTARLTTDTLPPGIWEVTATFTPTDENYDPSVSRPVTVVVGGLPGEQPKVEVIADVAPGAFSLTVAAPSAALLGGTVGKQSLGRVPQATVVDLRGTNGGWDLTAQVTDFVNQGQPTATIPGAELGWFPSAVRLGGSGSVSAGGYVASGTTPGGLADGVTLCSAPAGGSAGTFICEASLFLRIPDTTLPGDYAAALTLTLA